EPDAARDRAPGRHRGPFPGSRLAAQDVEEAAQALGLLAARGGTIDLEPIVVSAAEADAGLDRKTRERERAAARRRQVEAGVTLPPVLDESDVRVGPRGGFGCQHPRRSSIAFGSCTHSRTDPRLTGGQE